MILDFILIFTIVICLFMGYKNGITQMLISIVIFIFSITIVTQVFGHLEAEFFDSEFGSGMVDDVSNGINGEIDSLRDTITENSPFLGKYLFNDDSRQATENAVKDLSKKSVQVIVTVPMIIISFIIFKLLLSLVKFLASKTTNIPIIGGIDSILGSICGLVVGIVLVWLIYMSVCYLQFLPSAAFLKNQIDDSLVLMVINDFLHK